ncbi:phage tail family protein, partial [Cryobacterium sp. 10S3]|uniref:phage distal tail protein n=2 Tax=Cryobacterium sp. 10S3 TaxID=3048582 RepID=UPI002B23CB7C
HHWCSSARPVGLNRTIGWGSETRILTQFYGMRLITLTGFIFGTPALLESTRQAFEAAVSTGSILLTITTNAGNQYVINCYLDALDIPINRSATKAPFNLTLIAPDPTIYDNSAGGLQTASLVPVTGGGVTWPIAWTPVVWAPGGLPTTITNTGNLATYPMITLTGPATNPTITNISTGQFFSIQGLTTTGTDVIVIDMLNRTVLLNGGPILTYVTVTSSWFPLLSGSNSIKLTTGNSLDTVTGVISWRSGYRGI